MGTVGDRDEVDGDEADGGGTVGYNYEVSGDGTVKMGTVGMWVWITGSIECTSIRSRGNGD